MKEEKINLIDVVKKHITDNKLDLSDNGAGADVFQIRDLNVVFVHQVTGFAIRSLITNEDLGYIKHPDIIKGKK